MRDLFVTHDWRECEARDRALALIDEQLGLNWRNYGNCWYDPAIQMSTSEGVALIQQRLEGELTPSQAVVLVLPIYQGSQRGRTWVGLSLEIARRMGLPVVGLSETGAVPENPQLASLADRWVPWDGPALIAALDQLIAEAAARRAAGASA